MRGLNSLENIFQRNAAAIAKFRSVREEFEKKEKGTKANLAEARKLWKEMGEKFRWWGSLP